MKPQVNLKCLIQIMDKQKEITLSKQYVKDLYERSNEVEKNLLERMFGRSLFNPDKVIMERIKTFDDAYDEITNHPFAWEYNELCTTTKYETSANLTFTKLKIIAKALNGQCDLEVPNHKRWYPRFVVKKVNSVNEKTIYHDAVLVKRNGVYFMFFDVVSNDEVVSEASNINTCFRTRELAEYAGKQFIDIYADLIL